LEVDCADRAAGDDALTMVATAIKVDLVAEIDRSLRTDAHAGIAARADFEVDRVFLDPRGAECAQPAAQARELARIDRIAALGRQLAPFCLAGEEHANRELLLQRVGPAQRRR